MSTTHASRSPSARHRWGKCPGSVRLVAECPPQPSGKAAIDGTHSHTLFEHCIKGGMSDPRNMIGVKMSDHEGEFVIDEDRALRVKIAVDYVRDRVTLLGGMCEIRAETKVDPQFIFQRDDLGGTVDCTLIGGGVCEIIDYKDGMHPVDVEGNPQLEQYAFGVLGGYRQPMNQSFPFTHIRMTVIQPKLAAIGVRAIAHHEVSVEDLRTKRLGVLAAQVAATDRRDAPLVPGEEQCRYCPAKGKCTAFAEWNMGKVGVMFGDTRDEASKEVETVTSDSAAAPVLDVTDQLVAPDKNPATLSNEKLVEILEAAPVMRHFLEAVEAEALSRMKSGQSVPGLKLVNGRGSREWAMGEEEIAEKLKGLGLPKDAIWKTTLISPAQIEKVTWQNRRGERKSLSKRQAETIQNEYVTRMVGDLKVALATDERPAVMINAAPLFGAVSEQPAIPPTDVPVFLQIPEWMQP